MKICVVCSREITNKNIKCCSPECVQKWGRIKTKRNYDLHKQHSRAEAICIVCNQTFEYHFRPDRGTRQFHSRECASKYHIQNGTYDGWRLRVQPKTGIFVPCDECGEPKYIVTHQFTQEHHFCGRKCKGKFFGRLFSGEGNPMFGKKLSEESKHKQLSTLQKNHPGIKNAFMLSTRASTSKSQLEVFDYLKLVFPDLIFEIEQPIGNYKVDILLRSHKLIIEYNGDYWHANPETHIASDFVGKKQLTASQIWQIDKTRIYALQNQGYSLYVIWERNFLNKKQETLEMLQEWINGKKENLDVSRSSVDLADVKLGELLETYDDEDTTTQLETTNVNV